MSVGRWMFGIVLVAVLVVSGCGDQQQENVLLTRYLGEQPPGETPVLFAPGVVSTRWHEHSAPAFTPDGLTVYWTVAFTPGQNNFAKKFGNMMMTVENAAWSAPRFVTFLEPGTDFDICVSPDGEKLFFASLRTPYAGNKTDGDIWFASRNPGGWSELQPAGGQINTPNWEMQPSVSEAGTLYYTGWWEGGGNGYGIYRAERRNGMYDTPELLPAQVNTAAIEWTPFISTDETFLLFSSTREGGYGSGDIYIVHRQEDGSWSEAVNLGDAVNTAANERYPCVSPDGKYLFFLTDKTIPFTGEDFASVAAAAGSPGNGYCDIYWVDAAVLDSLK